MKEILKRLAPDALKTAMARRKLEGTWGGDRYECNFCGAKLRDFDWRGVDSEAIRALGIHPAGRRKVTCPFCGSYDRDRALWMFLQSRPELHRGPIRVLHIAPESTIEAELRDMPEVDYLSGDLDPALAMVRVDVTAMEFEDGAFDCVICNHVLEHVLDVHKAMTELLRVTKPGGWAILQVPIGSNLETTIEDVTVTDEQERLRRFGQIDHFRVFERRDYVNRLKQAGWNVEEIDYVGSLDPSLVERRQLNRNEILFFCTRPA